ncbi:LemA family protein [bacterium]|nr:LemA family protein [bacterium]
MLMVIVGIVVLIILYNLYAGVIKKKNKMREAMSGIDVQLRKRYDLIPNILTIAKKFMEHERGLMEDITKLRTAASAIRSDAETISKKIELDNQITSKMSQLLVSVENYPQLKSDQTMIQAMQTYAEVEEHIAAARRFYNSAVNDLNNAVEIFPSSIFAALLGIKTCPFFETEETVKAPISAADYLK